MGIPERKFVFVVHVPVQTHKELVAGGFVVVPFIFPRFVVIPLFQEPAEFFEIGFFNPGCCTRQC